MLEELRESIGQKFEQAETESGKVKGRSGLGGHLQTLIRSAATECFSVDQMHVLFTMISPRARINNYKEKSRRKVPDEALLLDVDAVMEGDRKSAGRDYKCFIQPELAAGGKSN